MPLLLVSPPISLRLQADFVLFPCCGSRKVIGKSGQAVGDIAQVEAVVAKAALDVHGIGLIVSVTETAAQLSPEGAGHVTAEGEIGFPTAC